MPISQQPPPFKIPFFDNEGHITDPWQFYLLKLQTNLSAAVAPSDAAFVIAQANATLTNATNLGLLSSGYLKIVTALSIATVSSVGTVPTTDLSGTLQAAQEPAHTGDVTNSAGSLALAIGAGKVTNTMLAGAIDLATKVTGILPAADFPALTGDVTTSAGSLATAIGASKVTNAMLAGSITFAKLVGTDITTVGKLGQYNALATVSNGVPSELATIDTTGLTANVAAATLYVVPASGEGLYRVSAYVVETTAGSISSTLPNVQIIYTDKDSNTSVTLDATPIFGVAGIGQTGALTANTIGTASGGVVPFYVKASTTIQYQTVNYASNLAGMTYALHIKLEAL